MRDDDETDQTCCMLQRTDFKACGFKRAPSLHENLRNVHLRGENVESMLQCGKLLPALNAAHLRATPRGIAKVLLR